MLNELMAQVDWDMMIEATLETLYMASVSLVLSVIIGLVIGIVLYITQRDGLSPNIVINKITDIMVNILRAVPFIIALYLLVPVTIILVGGMLGWKAAIPALTLSASPFFARMVVIALNEVDKGTIEACRAMGASKFQIMTKVLIPESMPALASSVVVTFINLVGYTAMAGAIGAGGLGHVAHIYGMVRMRPVTAWVATVFIVIIVLGVQSIGDYAVRRIDKR